MKSIWFVCLLALTGCYQPPQPSEWQQKVSLVRDNCKASIRPKADSSTLEFPVFVNDMRTLDAGYAMVILVRDATGAFNATCYTDQAGAVTRVTFNPA